MNLLTLATGQNDKSGASALATEYIAFGFCAWFILQYLRGYKPFVTVMEKDITLNNTI